MPPISRALSGAEETSPPAEPAISLLRWFITKTVDYLIRLAISKDSPFQTKYGDAEQPTFESVHAAWLYALQASDSTVVGNQVELAQLADQVRTWHRPIEISAASPLRLCFRLEEPNTTEETSKKQAGPSEDRWYVRYLLQAYDDPSLLIPLEDAWKSRGRKASALRRYSVNVAEHMLSSLGQAAGLCPHISASLENAAPAGYSLDTTAAHAFLTEKAILLEQSGFGVMLPAWWTRKGTKTHLSVRAKVKSPKMQGGGGLSLENVVQFDWELALGSKKLTQRELETLAKLKAPLIRLRGQWVEMNAAEIQRATEFWKNKGPEEARVRDIVQMAIGAKDAPGGFDFGGVKATGWIGKLLKQLDGRTEFEELVAPKAFSGVLRPYQVRGYSWLSFLRKWGLGACLADDMGLGKTIETLAMIERDWEAGIKKPVLLICPTSVVNNWQKEASRFTQELPVLIHHGANRKRGAAFAKHAQEHAMVVSSYGLLQRDIKSLQKVPWAGVVLDEAQNIKNPETKRARAARAIEADYRIALTGTPVENNVGDLWSIMEFLNPGILGTQTDFKRNFFIPIQAQRDPSATERLKRVTGPFILRRLKTDKSIISDLPEKMEMKVFCTLTEEQASLYAAVLKEVEESLSSVEGIQRKGVILATLSKLKQVCNHPTQFLGDNSRLPHRSGKLDRLTEMLEEIIAVEDRALIFTQFAEMGNLLKKHLQAIFGCEIPFLYGGVSKRKRDRMVDRFQDQDGSPIFLLSLKAGGTGLNLTGANHVFHFDRWWNPAVENQATDRAFRIGQTKNVQVHKFICAGTLEEKIDEMIERKKEIADTVVGTGEGWLTKLSNTEIKEIFALRKEVVGE
ncbi:MAG: DEAD/DEAH box helicase, partial [Candidatus Bipolaricaulota bacterium]|nr:DEAD/DEAH box helicase [Candidatus Bipolaricaulota bacterium]